MPDENAVADPGSPSDNVLVHSRLTSLARFSPHAGQRKTLQDLLLEQVVRDRSARAALADARGVVCISKAAAVSVSQVYLEAVLATTTDENEATLLALWQGLVLALETACSAHWLQRAQSRVAKHDWRNDNAAKSCIVTWTRSNPGIVGVALASPLDPSSDWTTDVLLPWTLEAWPEAQTFDSARRALSISPHQWSHAISPTLLNKVKSHPDKAWPVAQGWFSLLDFDGLSDEWWDVLAKALVHPSKDEWRQVAQQILKKWVLHAGDSSWISRLVTPTPPTLAPMRAHVYQTLALMSSAVGDKSNVATTLLPAMIPWWNKETKAEGKRACLQAAFAWSTEESALDTLSLAPWWSALTAKSSDAGLVLQDCPDYALPILASQGTTKLVWKSLVESAQTKRAMQQEGVLALYASLLCDGDKLPSWATKLIAAGSTKFSTLGPSKKTIDLPFFYQLAFWESTLPHNPRAAVALVQALVLYTTRSGDTSLWKANSCATHALVHALVFPGDCYNAIAEAVGRLSSLGELTAASLSVVNNLELDLDERRRNVNATRQARESDASVATQTIRIPTYALLRQALTPVGTISTSTNVANSLVILHMGTLPQTLGSQRGNLIRTTQQLLDLAVSADSFDRSSWCSDLSQEVLKHTTSMSRHGGSDHWVPTGFAVHTSATSVLTTLGKIASRFAPDTDDASDPDLRAAILARSLCTEYFAPELANQLATALEEVRAFSVKDVDIYMSPMGSLESVEDDIISENKVTTKKHLTDDEKWELQIKSELAQKKASNASSGIGQAVSADEQAKISQQDNLRRKMQQTVEQHYWRLLEAISAVALSDIEVGNSCLPTLAPAVLFAAVSQCPVFERIPTLERTGCSLLCDLASCVYELDELLAPDIAEALRIACRPASQMFVSQKDDVKKPSTAHVVCQPLPSPCDSAARVFEEMVNLHDVFSGASFSFLFPLIQSSMMGPRTVPGCESSVRILGMHTELLAGDEADINVQRLRKDMILCLLELLRHDRSQTFQNPSVVEVLVNCYRSSEAGQLTTTDLAPLTDQNGALGPKSCQIAAMMALERIASEQGSVLKNNPLVENRIWLCCYNQDADVRSAARAAWRCLKADLSGDSGQLPAPSAIFAAPLIPLLHSENIPIAEAAARAFAHAMSYHTKTVGRNIENLCRQYIDSYPSLDGPDSGDTLSVVTSSSKGSNAVALKQAKKTISTGLPKKKATGKKSALSIAGIGKPKTTKKKTSGVAAAALLKPKQERTLDQDELISQFTPAAAKLPGEKDTPVKIAVRLGVLRTFSSIANDDSGVILDEDSLQQLTGFLIAYGLAEIDEIVKSSARDTLRDLVATKGGSDEAISFLLPQLETVLTSGRVDDTSLKSLPTEKIYHDVAASDRRKEGAVVALGSVALHLKGPENELKIDSTVDMLLSALKTPSEDVQSSVADALTKLMKKGKIQARFEHIISDLMRECLHGDSLATRRGAAYGLAAAVKGGGIASLKKYEVVKRLEESCDTGGPSSKEGSLFAVELLSKRLGLLFEPYVIVLLPSLLKSFSDGSDYVRKAAANTAGVIMSKLSAHGVKLVMPAVLKSFDESAWRTKQASIQMLGSMSHLAPKQLASALPKVVPKLTEAFSDTHPKVKASAQEALNEISTVIRNPEIKEASPMLLKALTDPAAETQRALEGLIATEFLHAIDAPSLALIVPIVHRGLRDRGATVKRMGGLIAGNICTMINDPRDFLPYLPTLLPDLQSSLLDPIPDVRNTSAKALGTLARSLGEHILPELRPWLLQKLRDTACSSAERSGAAQGLTEVLIASGTEIVDEILRNELLPLSNYREASTREGVLWMITFLPPAMGQNFSPYIDASLGPLVRGLSDDNENVRDVAMRAGRVLIRSHGKVHLDKILPSLEEGLEDEDHRIRLASLSLLGDLLSTIGGTSVLRGDGDTQDDIRKAERAQAQIALVLGPDTRRRVLSKLYMARSDTTHAVRHSAIQIWKTVVSVTARALRDILAVLVNLIVTSLASGNDERTVVAGQCLGDVVSKLGDSVLPQIIPVLRKSLSDGDEQTKRGVCVGLTDVIRSSTKEQIIRFLEIITKLVQDAISDDDEQVRSMASSSFQELYTLVGTRAFDEIVPSLMVSLASEENGPDADLAQRRALNGLTGILSVRSRELLPYIIPRLVSRPITSNHAQALGRISSVTGATIHNHFTSIIPSLLSELAEISDESERIQSIRECSQSICASVAGNGVGTLVGEVASKCSSDKPSIRRESCWFFQCIVTECADLEDFLETVPVVLRELLYRLNDDSTEVLKAANAAFGALSKHVEAEELVKHIEFIRNLINSMVSDARRRKGGVGDGEFLLPGFNMPKGLDPLLPIYQRGILYGTPAIREVSATGLGEVLNLTASKYLAGPILVKMTGPLLRIVGDRNPSNVKIAILKTLGLILSKGGPALRAFVPQFQTTFVKALSDPSRQVRVEAIHALSLLMPLSTRVDPLIKELVAAASGKSLTVEGAAKVAIQSATLEALAQVLHNGGSKAKLPASIPSAFEASKDLVLESPDPAIRQSAAKALGEACSLLGKEDVTDFLDEIVADQSNDENRLHGQACAVHRVMAGSIGAELGPMVPVLQKMLEERQLSEGNQSIREVALGAWGALVGRAEDAKASIKASESYILPLLKDLRQPLEIHRAAAVGLATALSLWNPSVRVETLGVRLMDACLVLALQGTQRVQFAYNDVLWLALDVAAGTTAGLDAYCSITVFDNQRSVKSLHAKVLTRMKELTLLD